MRFCVERAADEAAVVRADRVHADLTWWRSWYRVGAVRFQYTCAARLFVLESSQVLPKIEQRDSTGCGAIESNQPKQRRDRADFLGGGVWATCAVGARLGVGRAVRRVRRGRLCERWRSWRRRRRSVSRVAPWRRHPHRQKPRGSNGGCPHGESEEAAQESLREWRAFR